MEWTNKEIRVAVIALHKFEIERARIFELLKPLNHKLRERKVKTLTRN